MIRLRRWLLPIPPLAVDFSRAAPAGMSGTSYGSLAGFALLVAGLMLAALAVVDIGAAEARADAAAERLATLRQAIARQGRQASVGGAGASAAAAAAGSAPAADEIRAAQKIATAVAAPWQAVLGELEAAAGPQIALLALDADAGNRTLRLSVEAASADEAFAYATRLGESDHFDDVAIVAHEEKQVGARTIFSFTLAIVWSSS